MNKLPPKRVLFTRCPFGIICHIGNVVDLLYAGANLINLHFKIAL